MMRALRFGLKAGFAATVFAGVASLAWSQGAGQLPSGYLWGNATTGQSVAAPVTPSAIIARSLAATSGNLLIANGSGWASQTMSGACTISSTGATLCNGNAVTSLTAGTGVTLTPSTITTAGSIALTVPVVVSSGGSGRTTLTNHGVLVGAGTSAITQLAVATSGTLMAGSAGADPTFSATPTLGASGTLGSLTFGNGTSGLLTLQPVTGALGTVTVSMPAATDTLVGKATTDAFTNKSFDTASAGNVLLINSLAATANTGTGAIVRATSPSISGLTVTSSLTATNLVGNASLAQMATNTIKGNNTAGTANAADLTVAQTQQLLGLPVYSVIVTGVDMNAVADTAFTIPLPTGVTRYRISNVIISNASANISAATQVVFQVFTGTGGSGTAVTASTACTVSATTESTLNNMQAVAANSLSLNNATLQFRVTTAHGSAATANVRFEIEPL